MGMHYSQIDLAERRKIQHLRDAKIPVKAIAAELGRHRSTIHREIRRNFYHDPLRDKWGHEYKGYYCVSANRFAKNRRRHRTKLTIRPALREHVITKLREGWSPQQIAGRLKREPMPAGTISHETIYRYVYGPEGREQNLYELLAMARRRRRQRYGRKPRSSVIPPENGIANRPSEIATRATFGHWECDLIIFARQLGKANVTSLQERKTRFLVLLSNENRQSAGVIGQISKALSPLPRAACQTVTFDRGTEFLSYKALNSNCYFCDPHSPWQKGGVENANGRIRRHLPLTAAVADRSAVALAAIAHRLNNTPRRCLSYQTPAEVFEANLAALTSGGTQVGECRASA